MDHIHVEESDLIDRYLMGRLPAEEAVQFEEHFVDCTECIDRLNITKGFMAGLRDVQIGQARDPFSRASNRIWSHVPKGFALAAAVMSMIALIGVVFVFTQLQRTRANAEEARLASAEWERLYKENRQSAASDSVAHQNVERELNQKIEQLSAQLEDTRKLGAGDGAEINIPILVPISTRGSGQATDSVSEITLPRSAGNFLISLGLEGENAHGTYRITIIDSKHQEIWSSNGIKATRENNIFIIFKSSLFKQGDYLLTLKGSIAGPGINVVGQYPFRVKKP